MLEPTIPGWKVETLGDDIAWMRFGDDGRLYAVNPEYGLFGVAPGTDWKTNPNAMRTLAKGNSIFTNVALHRRRRHLVGGHGRAARAPDRLERQRLDARTRTSSSSHPNSRFCTPITQCPILAPEYDDPRGRADLGDPLRRPPQDHRSRWSPRRATGCTASSWAPRCPSETTAAAVGQVGVVRRDPMAMLPFIGYHAGDYFRHWIEMGKGADGDADQAAARSSTSTGSGAATTAASCGPDSARTPACSSGSSSGSRAPAGAVETPIGFVPTAEALDLDRPGPPDRATSRRRCEVDADEWRAEIPQITEWFDKFGDKLPGVLWAELDALKARLGVTE